MATVKVTGASEVGPALRQARIDDGLTQSDLAAIANVGRQWLNEFEAGDKPSAPLNMVGRVAAALDVELTIAPSPRPTAAALPLVDLDDIIDDLR